MIDLERVPCPGCRADRSRPVVRGRDYLHGLPGEFFVAECDACGMWFQNPRPAAHQLADLYPADYRPHAPQDSATGRGVRMSAAKSRYMQKHLGYQQLPAPADRAGIDWRALSPLDLVRRWSTGTALVPAFVPGGRLLEIGCGSGERLLTLRDYGWRDLRGIELVPAAAAQARSHGFDVASGAVEDLLEACPDGSVDVIISSMVLEHLLDPFDVVRKVHAKLKPGGQFLFSTISRDSVDARMYGAYWAGFDFPRHMVHFRRRDLDRMLEGGFEQIEYFHQPAPIDFVRASGWRHADGQGRLVDRVVLRMGESRISTAVCLALAWSGLTCRVSCRCRRQDGSGVFACTPA